MSYSKPKTDTRRDIHPTVYTDGSQIRDERSHNKAAWGNYYSKGDPRNAAGRVWGRQTSRRAELEAIDSALKQNLREAIKGRGGPVRIGTDSKFSIESATFWAHIWEENGYITTRGRRVKNADVIKEIRKVMSDIQRIRGSKNAVQFEYVPAHSGNPGNGAAHNLAGRAARSDDHR